MLTPDVIEFKRRQLASLREAHPEPSPEVAAAIQRLADEVDPPRTHADELADQLAAAQAIIAGLQAQVADLTARIAAPAAPAAPEA